MKNTVIVCSILLGFSSAVVAELPGQFNLETDLFLPQFDSKTDVDDLHSIAGVATVLSAPKLRGIKVHAVAGAYGKQTGLYVPAPELFDAAFGTNWSDAHTQREMALETVVGLTSEALSQGGSVWVAEAGQSDFTADWLIVLAGAGYDTSRVHVVQHSDWNQDETTPEKLQLTRELSTYHRIADGNVAGNGTPGFKTDSAEMWSAALDHETMGAAWQIAFVLGNHYNGVEGRYLNETIARGGMDFSDVVETCWIFACVDLKDVKAFFERF